MSEEKNRLSDIVLDEDTLVPLSANAEHERRVALFDLKEANFFAVVGEDRGPYVLQLANVDGRLAFEVRDAGGERVRHHQMSLTALRKVIKDYAMICESYNNAIRHAAPSEIEAIDMGRRGLHNEAGEILMRALEERFTIDLETGRRLFTLICALHVRS